MRPLAFALCLACIPLPLIGQEKPEAAPGLRIPGTSVPYALDAFDGKPELVPIHHSNVSLNNHAGANIAGGLAGSFFYKPKETTELPGAKAAVTLHSRRPILYFHVDDEDESSGPNGAFAGWAIVKVKSEKDKRIVSQLRLTPVTGHGKHNEIVVDTAEAHLPGGWKTITPNADLADGQYALTPIVKAGNTFAVTVYAFGIDPNAPEADGAVKPETSTGSSVQ